MKFGQAARPGISPVGADISGLEWLASVELFFQAGTQVSDRLTDELLLVDDAGCMAVST